MDQLKPLGGNRSPLLSGALPLLLGQSVPKAVLSWKPGYGKGRWAPGRPTPQLQCLLQGQPFPPVPGRDLAVCPSQGHLGVWARNEGWAEAGQDKGSGVGLSALLCPPEALLVGKGRASPEGRPGDLASPPRPTSKPLSPGCTLPGVRHQAHPRSTQQGDWTTGHLLLGPPGKDLFHNLALSSRPPTASPHPAILHSACPSPHQEHTLAHHCPGLQLFMASAAEAQATALCLLTHVHSCQAQNSPIAPWSLWPPPRGCNWGQAG